MIKKLGLIFFIVFIVILAVVGIGLVNKKNNQKELVIDNEEVIEETKKDSYYRVIQVFGEDLLTGYNLEVYSDCTEASCTKETFEIKSASGTELSSVNNSFVEGNIKKTKVKKTIQPQCIKAPCDKMEIDVEVVEITDLKEVKIPEDKKAIIEKQTLN